MSNKWLSIIRWVAAVSPPTGFPLFRPVLTQEPSLSPLTIRAEGCERLVSSSAIVGGPCGRTGSFHQESDLLEHVRDLYRAHLAFDKLNPPLTITVARAR